jgi:hypothetical protein
MGLSPALMSNPASVSSLRQYRAFHSSLSRRSVLSHRPGICLTLSAGAASRETLGVRLTHHP